MIKQCLHCKTDFKVKPCHIETKKYCSKLCADQARQVTITCLQCGKLSVQPQNKASRTFCNIECFREYRAQNSIAKVCICKTCGIEFKTYEKSANTCSAKCRDMYEHVELKCKCCGTAFQEKRSHAHITKYCSEQCMATDYKVRFQGEANPNYRTGGVPKICPICSNPYTTYSKQQKHCSRRCDYMARQRRPAKIDLNQPGIVLVLRQVGASIIDTSDIGNGFPDLVVGFRGKNYLLEIKNQETHYGRKGLNPNQQEWCDTWHGNAPIVVYTANDALRAIGAIE